MPRRTALVLLAIGLAGCFTSTGDFSDDAADFIQNDENLHVALGVTEFTSVNCEDPENRDVGTRFPCVGVDSDDREWAFEVEILDGDEYVVSISKAP